MFLTTQIIKIIKYQKYQCFKSVNVPDLEIVKRREIISGGLKAAGRPTTQNRIKYRVGGMLSFFCRSLFLKSISTN